MNVEATNDAIAVQGAQVQWIGLDTNVSWIPVSVRSL